MDTAPKSPAALPARSPAAPLPSSDGPTAALTDLRPRFDDRRALVQLMRDGPAAVDRRARMSALFGSAPIQRVKVETVIETKGGKAKLYDTAQSDGAKSVFLGMGSKGLKDQEAVFADFALEANGRVPVYSPDDKEKPLGYVAKADVRFVDLNAPMILPPPSLESLGGPSSNGLPGEFKAPQGSRELDGAIQKTLKLIPFASQPVTTFDKVGASGVARREAETVLYHPSEDVSVFHGSKTMNEKSILENGLDPKYGGGGGAAGLLTEPFNARGYVYAAVNFDGAKAAAKNFFEGEKSRLTPLLKDQVGNREKIQQIRDESALSVFEAKLSPSVILVQDPDLFSAVRTTSPLKTLRVVERFAFNQKFSMAKVETRDEASEVEGGKLEAEIAPPKEDRGRDPGKEKDEDPF